MGVIPCLILSLYNSKIMAELTIVILPAKILADKSHRIRIRINQTLYITTRFKTSDKTELY